MRNYLRFLAYLKPYRWPIALTWLLSVLVVGLQCLSVWVGTGFLEQLLGDPSSAPGPAGPHQLAQWMDHVTGAVLQRSTPFRSLLAGVSVLIGAVVLTATLRVLKSYAFTLISQQVLVRLRSEMFDQLTRLDLTFSRTHRPGEIASLFLRDVDQMEGAIIDAMDRIFMQPLRLVVVFALMASQSLTLTLWVFCFLVVSSLVVVLAGNRIETVTRRLVERAADLQGILTEYLSVAILARSLGREETAREEFVRACRKLSATTVESNLVRSVAPQGVSALFVLCGGLLILLGGYWVSVSRTMAGAVVVRMALLVPMAAYPLESLALLYMSVRASVASVNRIFALLDREPAWVDVPDACEPPPLASGIELREAQYQVNRVAVIKGISFTIPRGSRVLITGPSGAGKTSVLGLLAGFIRPTAGSILVDGVPLDRFRGTAWRRRLGIVIQDPILLNATVRENLRYACPDATDEQLKQVLTEALLWTDVCVLPLGLETPVGNRGELLSGGERQRLTIARALLNRPEVLLLDEPTAMLDLQAKVKLKETLEAVSRGRTLVFVSHDHVLRDLADLCLQMQGGRLVNEVRPLVAAGERP
ncbi:MAG: ABC transporter ATP-binding protein [Candidatus Riflebacteria bacterium]|nr:ABC transporter ATP-binding protein [Candidatus Riflebacteria bacterium]